MSSLDIFFTFLMVCILFAVTGVITERNRKRIERIEEFIEARAEEEEIEWHRWSTE